jgi:Aminoglycoside/hydroxyurea antibiotic resistance kinase
MQLLGEGTRTMESDEDLFIPPDLREASMWWDWEGQEWLRRLPELVARYERQWAIRVGRAFSPGGKAAFVAPAVRSDGSPAVLKLSLPDPAMRHEAAALRLYGGEGAVQLYDHDPDHLALLLERCRPGTPLIKAIADPHEQIVIGARVLHPAAGTGPVARRGRLRRCRTVPSRVADYRVGTGCGTCTRLGARTVRGVGPGRPDGRLAGLG